MSVNNPTETQQVQEKIQISETQIKKMFHGDRRMLVFWMIFMWIILGAVYLQVMAVADPTVRIVALVSGILVGAFNTVAMMAVSGHLNQKKNELYGEDIYYQEKMQGAGGKKWNFVMLFDVLFILILCYICLLIPILLRGKVLVGGGGGGGMDYSFTWVSLVLCLGAGVIFGYFLLTHSEKELKTLIDNVYGKKGETK